MSMYELGLEKTPANYLALSPISFIERSAAIYPHYPAVVHGALRRTWSETYQRCRQLASALVERGISLGDTVSVLLPNIPEMLEAHFAIPMAGAVLNPLNVRLDANAIAFMLEHAESKVLIADREYHHTVKAACAKLQHPPLIIDVNDPEYGDGLPVSDLNYEAFLAEGDPLFQWSLPENEWQAISLNYTSGTTGNPKGVVYHHRGAFLNATGNQMSWSLGTHPVYLWTLPMFHCNGWCYPWTITALAGVHVCLRRVDPQKILHLIRQEKVTHFCGAPIILNALISMPESAKAAIEHPVSVMVAGAAPAAKIIHDAEQMGIQVTHVYGLTEVYGPATYCAWNNDWDLLPADQRAEVKARQGVRYPTMENLMVADSKTLAPTPADGVTIGEIFMRGNTVMKGYLKNPKATQQVLANGWLNSGDLAVRHPDGYIEIKDRLKDIIISGGENISSLEIESVLYRHPAVLETAVVAQPNAQWGEIPCAFITLKAGFSHITSEHIKQFCSQHLAAFKVPKTIIFDDLPKTSTGKTKKYLLREIAKEL